MTTSAYYIDNVLEQTFLAVNSRVLAASQVGSAAVGLALHPLDWRRHTPKLTGKLALPVCHIADHRTELIGVNVNGRLKVAQDVSQGAGPLADGLLRCGDVVEVAHAGERALDFHNFLGPCSPPVSPERHLCAPEQDKSDDHLSEYDAILTGLGFLLLVPEVDPSLADFYRDNGTDPTDHKSEEPKEPRTP